MLLPAINFFCLILAKVAGVLIHLFDNSLIIMGPVLRHGHHGFALEVAKECSGLSASAVSQKVAHHLNYRGSEK